MKAIVIHKHGSASVLKYEDVPLPSIKPDSLLVKVRASSVNPIDWKLRNGLLKLLTSFRLPMILGSDFSGDIVSVGDKVTGLLPGESVYGFLGLNSGAYAEYVVVPAQFVASKPRNLSYEEAAAVPLAACTALQAWRDRGNLHSGQKVLINGASGGVGTFAIQIAKALGAHVTSVCSTKNIELVKSLGSDRTVDYTQDQFTEDSDRHYDIVFDVVGKQSFNRCRSLLGSRGIYITTLPRPLRLIRGLFTEFSPGPKSRYVLANPNSPDLNYLKDLIEAENLHPIIDRIYPLTEVAAAHSYSEAGHAVGKIVLKVAAK